MSNVCECCGKKNNSFVGDPLSLPNNKILCHKCAEPVIGKLNQLYYATTPEEFDVLTKAIIAKSKNLFSDDIIKDIEMLIDARGKKLNFIFDEELGEYVQPIPINSNPMQSHSGGGLFKNIGRKIKGMAQLITWIGIIASIVIGFSLIMIDDDMALIGVLIMFVGSFFSWASSFLLYGFGQLIDNSDKILNQLKK